MPVDFFESCYCRGFSHCAEDKICDSPKIYARLLLVPGNLQRLFQFHNPHPARRHFQLHLATFYF